MSGQNSVQISVSTTIQLNRDDLTITCSAIGNYDSITLYTIHKNVSGSATLQKVVTKQYSISSQFITTIWDTFDSSLQNRAILTGVDPPSASATMTMTIPRDQVRCPDAGGYVCTYSSTPPAGSTGITTNSISDQQFVSISSKKCYQLNLQKRKDFYKDVISFITMCIIEEHR